MILPLQTKMKLAKAAADVYEAFVDPTIMAHYWFSSDSGRWEQGKTVTLRYEEYNASLAIKVLELVEHQKIVYQWGPPGEETVVTIALEPLDSATTVISVTESGWNEQDAALTEKLVGNKEGWVYVLACLKAYLEFGVHLRGALVKD